MIVIAIKIIIVIVREALNQKIDLCNIFENIIVEIICDLLVAGAKIIINKIINKYFNRIFRQ